MISCTIVYRLYSVNWPRVFMLRDASWQFEGKNFLALRGLLSRPCSALVSQPRPHSADCMRSARSDPRAGLKGGRNGNREEKEGRYRESKWRWSDEGGSCKSEEWGDTINMKVFGFMVDFQKIVKLWHLIKYWVLWWVATFCNTSVSKFVNFFFF